MIKKLWSGFASVLSSQGAKDIYGSKRLVFAVSGLLGALFFIHVYGALVLNPTYTDWLMNPQNGDLVVHYLGWEFFRSSPWSFPLGLAGGFNYPSRVSVMFTDSIPLFAIPFKAISELLPQSFQYFGWYGLLAYILQGGIAALVIKRLTGSPATAVIGSLFFTMSSIMMFRMFAHTALASHFIILLAFYACITKDKERSFLKNTLIWGGLLCLAVSVHPYFLVMVFVMMFFCFADDIFEYRHYKKTAGEFGLCIAMLLVVMYLIGFFYSDSSMTCEGMGLFSTNLNSIVNPWGMSRFLRDLPQYRWEQLEGNAYIGFGIIILIFVALFAFADDFKLYIKKLSDKTILRRVIFSVLIFVGFYIMALSPTVTLNERALFTYPVPAFAEELWSIFRASGRLIWPAVYMIMIAVIWVTAKKFNKGATVAILVVLVFVQYRDMSDYFSRDNARFREAQVWESELRTDMWDIIARDYNHLFYTTELLQMESVLHFAMRNQMTVNDAIFARRDVEAIGTLKHEVLVGLNEGRVQNDKVYIFHQIPTHLILAGTLYVYEFDGLIAGFASEIESAANMENVLPITPELIADEEFLFYRINEPVALESLVSIVTASPPDEDGNILVCVTNLSEINFISLGVRPITLGVSLYSPAGRLIDLDFERILINEPIRPGEQLCFVYSIPFDELSSGQYMLSFRLVQETVRWFPLEFDSNRAFAGLNIP